MWGVGLGDATVLGSEPVKVARPGGLPRRGHCARKGGQEKPSCPFLQPLPPGELTSLFKSPSFPLPHRTQDPRTNPLITVTFPNKLRAVHPRFGARDPGCPGQVPGCRGQR